MKTLPIRCRPGDTRPIRAIAYEATDLAKIKDPNHEPKQRDNCPTHKFFEAARANQRESWIDLMALLNFSAAKGPPDNKEKYNSLGDGLYEFKSWGLRLICFYDEGSLIICTHGYFKQSQGMPKKEKTRALNLKNAYFEAKKRNQILHVQPK